MKKSMIAAAVVATAFAASANAGYFSVTNAQIDGTNIAGGSFNLDTPTNTGWTGTNGVAQQANGMDAGDVTTLTNIGLTAALQEDTLTYFGFEKNGMGYFGMAFENNSGSAVVLDIDFTRLNQASQGVLVAGASTVGTYDNSTGLGTWSTSNITVNVGSTLFVVFGGFNPDHNPAIQGTVNFNALTDVSYLAWDSGTTWSVVGSGNGLTSNMQFATFQIPVPAPALLAGAGLIGAAAIRRRMAKKA